MLASSLPASAAEPPNAPVEATTGNGDRVLLYPNGRWEYVNAQKAVEDDPSLPSTQLVLGRALTETGDAKEGIEHLEKTEQWQPDNLEVHIALAKAYSKSGRKEDSRRERMLCLEMTKNETTPAAHP